MDDPEKTVRRPTLRGPDPERQREDLVRIPPEKEKIELLIGFRKVKLTNLQKPFWPELGITKGNLLQYYADVAPALLPHLLDRAMVMKRYPNGAAGEFFFMKRAPSARPQWIETCEIEHASGNVINFPIVRDLPSLLWIVNLGCIDLNPWYARCDDIHRPDYLHFDLDPVTGDEAAPFARIREAALIVKDALDRLRMPAVAKSSGSRGIHVYIPIVRGPTQKQVWTFAKAFAKHLASENDSLLTAEYRVAKRPAGRILVDYNQNAWGRTLASVYSVRPNPAAAVSAPVTWEEVANGFDINDFTIKNVPDRIGRIDDLWTPLHSADGRVNLEEYL